MRLIRTLPGGTDGGAFLERFDTAVAHIAGSYRDGDTVAVISHGAAIRV